MDSSGNGFYAGSLHVNGSITAGTKDFKIDDPIDPANKYLYHTSVESPDMLNIYNGSVKLNARGEAWVELPAYFESLNRDFQYVLTALGRPQPTLYIAQKVRGNRFKVAGGKPYGEVSWQVTGIRHDAFAEAYRGPVEEEKPTGERGTYLHPELFVCEQRQELERAPAALKSHSDSSRPRLSRVTSGDSGTGWRNSTHRVPPLHFAVNSYPASGSGARINSGAHTVHLKSKYIRQTRS